MKKWFQRGEKAHDPFDRFFCLWIALIVAAQRLRTHRGVPSRRNNSDRKKVLDYFRANSHNVLQALQENHDSMLKSARRRGTNYGHPIVDIGNQKLRDKFSRLVAYYTQDAGLSQADLVETVAALLNKIRNNLFHGVKVYDDREDVELLELVNPVLRAILRKCEPL